MDNMVTLEQKVNIVLRYIVSNSDAEKAELRAMAAEALEANFESSCNIEDLIAEALRKSGTPLHLQGYDYLVLAIKLYTNNVDYYHGAIHSRLYRDVAKQYDTTANRVERCIRHAIERTFENIDLMDLSRIYGNTVNPDKGKLTNNEFISFWAKEIQRRIKEHF